MKISQAGLRHLMDSEGYENSPYNDVAGYLTIGVGHLITSAEKAKGAITINGQEIPYATGLTDQQVMDLLAQDVTRFEDAVNDLVSVPLTQGQFDCLVSFSFNCGTGNFENSTLLRVLNDGQYDQVPNQLRRWVRAGGVVVEGLKRRREREIELWES